MYGWVILSCSSDSVGELARGGTWRAIGTKERPAVRARTSGGQSGGLRRRRWWECAEVSGEVALNKGGAWPGIDVELEDVWTVVVVGWAAARSGGCHGHTVEQPQPAQPQADHCLSNRRSRPQDASAHRHQAPSGKPGPRLEADVDHSGGIRQLRPGQAAVILRFRAATAALIRLPASEAEGLPVSLTATVTATTAVISTLTQP